MAVVILIPIGLRKEYVVQCLLIIIIIALIIFIILNLILLFLIWLVLLQSQCFLDVELSGLFFLSLSDYQELLKEDALAFIQLGLFLFVLRLILIFILLYLFLLILLILTLVFLLIEVLLVVNLLVVFCESLNDQAVFRLV
jgi:hypothetical protein